MAPEAGALPDLKGGVSPAKLRVLKRLVLEATDNDWTQERLFREVKNVIGLSDRDATALANFRSKLIADGVPPGKVRREAARYSTTLLNQRALTVATTERLAQEQGDLIRDAEEGSRKKWVTHKDERRCPVCKPLHGTVMPLNHDYGSGKLHPPLHPNCRCKLQIMKPARVRKDDISKAKVRTPAGAKKYKLPIGSPIVAKPNAVKAVKRAVKFPKDVKPRTERAAKVVTYKDSDRFVKRPGQNPSQAKAEIAKTIGAKLPDTALSKKFNVNHALNDPDALRIAREFEATGDIGKFVKDCSEWYEMPDAMFFVEETMDGRASIDMKTLDIQDSLRRRFLEAEDGKLPHWEIRSLLSRSGTDGSYSSVFPFIDRLEALKDQNKEYTYKEFLEAIKQVPDTNNQYDTRLIKPDTDGSYTSITLGMKEAIARGLVSRWAQTSNDHSPASLAMQRVAEELFGFKGEASEWRHEVGGVDDYYDEHHDLYVAFLTAQYEATQEMFARDGVTEVELFRGFGSSAALHKNSGENIDTVKVRPLSSWSADLNTAKEFAASRSEYHRYVMAATVPVGNILSTPLTGFGCQEESEYVVIGPKLNVNLFDAFLAMPENMRRNLELTAKDAQQWLINSLTKPKNSPTARLTK